VVDGRKEYKILMGIAYPRTQIENLNKSRRKK
jgi:hypothetical protein